MRVKLLSKENAGRSVGFIGYRILFDMTGSAELDVPEAHLEGLRRLGWLSPEEPPEAVSEDDPVSDTASSEETATTSSVSGGGGGKKSKHKR